MPEDKRFTVFVSNADCLGGICNFRDNDYLRYDDLTWAEAVELGKLSFTQGYGLIIWAVDDESRDE